MKTKTCESCLFSFQVSVLQGGDYQCRFEPPKAVPIITSQGLQGMLSLYPMVKKTEWCGKYEEKVNDMYQ